MKKMVGILLTLFIITATLSSAHNLMLKNNTDDAAKKTQNIYQTSLARGNTLISDRLHNRVIEVDDSGNIVWEKTDMGFAADAERLPNGNTLIAALGGVYEVDISGNIVWQKNTINNLDVERLENGNTLIISWDMEGYNWILEVDSAGSMVWSKAWEKNTFFPWDVERLTNGNTLIAGTCVAYEIDSSNNEVWRYSTVYTVVDVERLDNGNTLIVEFGSGKVIEIDPSNNIVWGKLGLSKPIDAERLEDGNTLIVESTADRVIEVDSSGNIVWQKDTNLDAPYDAERIPSINHPPAMPTRPEGPTQGYVGESYTYSAVSTDPEGDKIKYYFDWGDRTGDWTNLLNSGETAYMSHTWDKTGRYMFRVRAVDENGLSSGHSWIFVYIYNAKIPDLDCEGTIIWSDVKPGTTVTGTIEVINVGEEGSLLNGEISEYPDWGTWSFNPPSGNDLKPEDEPVEVVVQVISPNEENKNYTGEIKIINLDNPDDNETIPVSLTTPKNKVFNTLLIRFLERYPLIYRILQFFI